MPRVGEYLGGLRATGNPFGTVIVDPPWPYQRSGEKHSMGRGYSNYEYPPLAMTDLESLPVGELADYLFLWTTPAFDGTGQACRLAECWGFTVITTIYWVKVKSVDPTKNPAYFEPSYGVGYWFRGCVEPILVCKNPKVQSIRTAWVGLLSKNAGHSRKPNSLYEIVEKRAEKSARKNEVCEFPGPYCELFARERRRGWTCFGNQAPGDGKDIRISLVEYLDKMRGGTRNAKNWRYREGSGQRDSDSLFNGE